MDYSKMETDDVFALYAEAKEQIKKAEKVKKDTGEVLQNRIPPNTVWGFIFHKMYGKPSISYKDYAAWIIEKFVPKPKHGEAKDGLETFKKENQVHDFEVTKEITQKFVPPAPKKTAARRKA